MSPIRSRRRAGSRTEKSPSRAEDSAASSDSRLSTFAPVPSSALAPFVERPVVAAVFVPFDARFAVDVRLAVDARPAAGFLAAGFCVVDFAAAPALADLLLPALVRAWATAPLLLHES